MVWNLGLIYVSPFLFITQAVEFQTLHYLLQRYRQIRPCRSRMPNTTILSTAQRPPSAFAVPAKVAFVQFDGTVKDFIGSQCQMMADGHTDCAAELTGLRSWTVCPKYRQRNGQ